MLSDEGNNYVLPEFSSHDVVDYGMNEGEDFISEYFDSAEETADIQWCQNPYVFEPLLSTIEYDCEFEGHTTSIKEFSYSAALLVEVPKFIDRCVTTPPATTRSTHPGRSAATTTPPPKKKKKTK